MIRSIGLRRTANRHVVRASFDEKQFEDDRISAVRYVRISLGAEVAAAFRDPATPVALRVDHPAHEACQPIEGVARASLAADLVVE